MKSISSIILQFVKNKKMIFIAMMLLSVFGMILSYYRPIFTQRLIDEGLNYKEYRKVLYCTLLIILSVIIQQTAEFIQTLSYVKLKNQFIIKLYNIVLVKVYRIHCQYFNKNNSVSVSNTLSTDISNISMLFDKGTLITVNYSIITLGGILGLFKINIFMTLLIIVFVPIKLFFVLHFSKKVERLSGEIVRESEKFYEWWGDNINGNKEVKLWCLLTRKVSRLIQKQRKILKKQFAGAKIECYNTTFDVLMEWLIRALIYILAGYMVCQNRMTVGTLLAFISYTEYIIGPISSVLYIKFILAHIRPSIKHLETFMRSEDETNLGSLTPSCFNSLELKNICFSYGQREILHNVNLHISRGQKIAIVGNNGSGKTTLINIISRILKEDSGQIFLNGEDINQFDIESYRNLLSICSQQAYLFKDKLRENLDLKKQLSDEEIIRRCSIYERLSKEALKIVVENNASNLSGGEKQKVVFMRALCKGTDVYILDEPDASLDKISSKKLESILDRLEEKTVILITHKKITFNNLDSVYELDKGRLTKIL